jgi:SSS family solute:Na+ symporter
MYGISILDILVLIGACAVTIIVGVVASRRVKGETDYYLAGRKLGPFLQFFMNFGMMTDSSGAPVTASAVYESGISGMWLSFQPLFNTPFFWFTSVWWRRTRLITSPDQFMERFNSRPLAMAMSIYAILIAVMTISLGNIIAYNVASAMFVKPVSQYTVSEKLMVNQYHQYRALRARYQSATLSAKEVPLYQKLRAMREANLLRSSVSYVHRIPFYLVFVGIIASYIILGGVRAAAYTDAIQGVLILAFSVLLIPMGLKVVGGFAGLHHALAASNFDIFGGGNQSGLQEWTWYSIAAFVLLGVISNLFPNGVSVTGRDEKAIRIGVLGGAFTKRFVMILWALCGLIALAMFSGAHQLSNPDHAWGAMSKQLLGPGLLGLMIAGLLLGHMPNMGNYAIIFASTFNRNIYEPMVRGRSPGHYMLVAKTATAVILLVSILGAIFFGSIAPLWIQIVALNAFLGATGAMMFAWRRFSAMAAGLSWIIWIVVFSILPWTIGHIPALAQSKALTREASIKLPIQTAPGAPPRYIIDRHPVFFAGLRHVDATNPQSPMEGHGRFRMELYTLSLVGLPVDRLSVADIRTIDWLFDALAPLALMFILGLVFPSRESGKRRARLLQGGHYPQHVDGAPDAGEYAAAVMRGNLGLMIAKRETGEQACLRVDRFYAKFRTPVPPHATDEEAELAESFRRPDRYDHLKMFPKSDWEFTRPSLRDIAGFAACWVGVVIVLIVLAWVMQIR